MKICDLPVGGHRGASQQVAAGQSLGCSDLSIIPGDRPRGTNRNDWNHKTMMNQVQKDTWKHRRMQKWHQKCF